MTWVARGHGVDWHYRARGAPVTGDGRRQRTATHHDRRRHPYGDKDLLAIGIDGQSSDGNKAYSADFPLEKELPNFGVVDVESEYAKYDHFGGYAGDTSNGYYVLGSYMFPQVVGVGRFQPLVKYAHANYTFDTGPSPTDTQKTVDVELNYIIKQFNARVSLYYLDVKYDHDVAGIDHKVVGLGLQLQM